LMGGKTFCQRMERSGMEEKERLQIQRTSTKLISVYLVDLNRQVELGGGEAKKIIIEVISNEPNR